MPAREYNFDGIIGPTHHYGGLARGNRASMRHRADVARPRLAARQGLAKMKLLADLGVPQAVLPPLYRPRLDVLREIGFNSTSTEDLLRQVAQSAPDLLSAVFSASSMWAANAATVTPSGDAEDGRVHFTAANLATTFHRSLEAGETSELLRRIFSSERYFCHHRPLPAGSAFSDEGAANHVRLSPSFDGPGIHLFVYGREYFGGEPPTQFPRRQTKEASVSIARRHGISPVVVVFSRQNPVAIESGVFHNDVISTGHNQVFLYHESAFADGEETVTELARLFVELTGTELELRCGRSFSLADAVESYFYNSQIVTTNSGDAVLIAPEESRENPAVANYIAELISDPTCCLQDVHFVDLRQSMQNGGGPACLRNRIILTEEEATHLRGRVIWSDDLGLQLDRWVDRHYRETLEFAELVDPTLVLEAQTALDELTQILELGSIYPFQR
jgi:succinylarginine dihydrolase